MVKMEVRSNIEKCGADSISEPAAEKATIAITTKSSTEDAIAKQSKTTANEKSVNGMNSALTKDEKLVAELKSQIPDVDNIFLIHRRIGEGTFSTVFLTSLKGQESVPAKRKRFFALKYLIPTSHPKRVAQELRCLKEIGGKGNVVGVEMCLRNNDAIAFVMPYIPHDRFQDYFDKFNTNELQNYMRNLLIALKHVHGFDVIHRDVKPSNFLHDRKNQKYLLVDFGLAQTLDKEFDSTKPINSRKENNDTMHNLPHVGSYECDNDNNNSDEPQRQHECQPPVPNTEVSADCAAIISNRMTNAVESIQLSGNANKYKRKASENEETEKKSSKDATEVTDTMVGNVKNPSKRARTIINQSNQNRIDDSTGNENAPQQSGQLPRVQYIPSTFKSPLKQLNEISTPNNLKRGIALDSPLTRHIKSAVLGYSINLKIQNQRNSGNTSAATPKSNETSIDESTTLPHSTVVTPKNIPSMNATIANKISMPNHKYNVDNRRIASGGGVKCYCYGRPTVCNVCIVKREIHAPRAGTPGYRPSEVLLKYPNQTTAVDVWAAGVILISILSGCYPFFKGTDDFTALAEIITVFGDEIVKKTALALGRHVCIKRKKRPLHLRKLCIRLRNRCKMQNTPFKDNINSTKLNKNCDNCEQMVDECLCQDTDYNMDFTGDTYPDSVYDLLAKLLAISPNNRISADQALNHQFFQENY